MFHSEVSGYLMGADQRTHKVRQCKAASASHALVIVLVIDIDMRASRMKPRSPAPFSLPSPVLLEDLTYLT